MSSPYSAYRGCSKRRVAIVDDPYMHSKPTSTILNIQPVSPRKSVNAQLEMYRSKQGIFARPAVIKAAESMPAHKWWNQNGASVPRELRSVACLVLAQPASASIIERINSEFAFVKDRRRNRLCHSRANKLVSLLESLPQS